MTPRLLANENFPRPALLALRQAGADVEAVAELMPGATDTQVLLHAAAGARWVLTFDRDYGELVFARTVPPPPALSRNRAPRGGSGGGWWRGSAAP